ncbi:MAG: putative selenium-dependent hydroxylase accessory protein YqeC [Desulforhopalus sp.]|jgi:probable selenium-dependent hydroxylase accessory protein YqeC
MSPVSSFIRTFGLGKGGVVCIVGAGGKTSLLFHLAGEARSLGYRALVSTTTKMLIPDGDACDDLDLSGHGFMAKYPLKAGVYVAGSPVSQTKMEGLAEDVLFENSRNFDLVLLEADGAAKKPLKGWLQTEPVIPGFTTHTIGIIDIQTVGKTVGNDLVHRLDCFCTITGAEQGDVVTTEHLEKIVSHENGLFLHGTGKRIVYINKVESKDDRYFANELKARLPKYNVCSGSVKMNKIVSNNETI